MYLPLISIFCFCIAVAKYQPNTLLMVCCTTASQWQKSANESMKLFARKQLTSVQLTRDTDKYWFC